MRLFIATSVNTEVEQELARVISALKSVGGPVKWVAPSNIHLTLKFLGDTAEDSVPQIRSIIDETAAKHVSISTQLNALGAFPDFRRPRVFWVGIESGKDKLSAIAADLEDGVFQLGFAKENRPFKSHLTIGRVKSPGGLKMLVDKAKNTKVNQVPLTFDRIILFKSTLTPRGPIYEILHEARLK